MVERDLVIDHLKFSYEGLFNASELYNLISNWFYDKGWDWYERMNQEQITSAGKQIKLVLEPWKCVSDYYKLVTYSLRLCRVSQFFGNSGHGISGNAQGVGDQTAFQKLDTLVK